MSKTTTRTLAVALICASALAVSVPASWALPALRATPGYKYERIDHPSAGMGTTLTSIAENGDVSGAYADAAGRFHGFVHSGATGTFSDIDVPGARDTYVLGLNAGGAISGTFVDAGGAQHGFVRDAAGLRTIDIPGAVSTTPATSEFGTGLGTAVGTIRDDGAIVGAWGDGAGAEHGFLIAPGRPRVDLDAPGASNAMDPLFQTEGGTGPVRSNLQDDVVGSFVPARRTTLSPVDRRAFIRRGTTWTTLLPAGAVTSQAFGLDEHGTVGGVAFDFLGLTGYGWVWRNGAFKRIDPAPLLVLSTVADVSETGVLVGETVTPDTKIHGYIARPTS
jgi:hypothetical protein